MVEHQLPKLMTGVRFPSPAPKKASPADKAGFLFLRKLAEENPGASTEKKKSNLCEVKEKAGLVAVCRIMN